MVFKYLKGCHKKDGEKFLSLATEAGQEAMGSKYNTADLDEISGNQGKLPNGKNRRTMEQIA